MTEAAGDPTRIVENGYGVVAQIGSGAMGVAVPAIQRLERQKPVLES
jgi:hypothetical protein